MLAPLPPPTGGIASWAGRYEEYCKKNNINLRIVNIAMTGERATTETMNRSIITELKRTYNIINKFKVEVKKDKPDVVHINTSCSNFGIFRDALCVLSLSNKIPFVLHCHCNIENELSNNLSKKAFRYLVKKADKVIVLNEFSLRYVENIVSNKAIYIPNFASEKMLARNHIINDEIKKIIYVGHVEKSKGIVQIVEAANKLQDIQFTLVGAVREDISYIELPTNIRMVGKVTADEVQSFLKDADVFVFPSKSEGFSIAVLEAMAMGLPIIASNVGANAAMIENKGGVILAKNTGENIFQAINSIKDKETRRKMSIWNIEKVKSSYMIDSVMKQYFDVYEDVM